MSIGEALLVVVDFARVCGADERRRVVIQRNAVTRERPALRAGWKATVQLMVNLPEYVSPQELNEVLGMAGRLVGVGDFRPSFGRFLITKFAVK